MRLRCWLLVLLCACAGNRALEEDRAYQLGVAAVESIDVTVHRERPVSVDVTVSGRLPDPCTLIYRTQQERRSSGITVTLTTRRESGASCEPEPRPFQRTISLDIHGMPPGLYFVSVNGVSGTFQILANAIDGNGPEHDRIF
jgi:hypothetical protein